MKNVIYNYYNILVYDINKDGNDYYFYYDDELYYFCLVLNDIDTVLNIYKYVLENGIECFEIILNKNGSLYSDVEDKKYSLLRVNGILKYEYKFEDFKFYPVNKEPYNWGELWGERLDYYEIQLRELGYKYQTVLNSFGMFSGLAENAILYFNLTRDNFNEEVFVGVVHNRMRYPCYLIDYNNPLNFVIDYHIRDIAEYIKSYMFSDEFDVDNVIVLIEKLSLNNIMFNLLYSRLLYPTFYFDIFDKIILEDGVDSDIVGALDVVDKYLSMLRVIYLKFSKRYRMFEIEWLCNDV